MKWLKRIFCFHSNWSILFVDFQKSITMKNGYYLGEGYWRVWRCVNCGKHKSFKDPGPIQYVEPEYNDGF